MQQAKFNASAFKLSLIASAIAGMAFSSSSVLAQEQASVDEQDVEQIQMKLHTTTEQLNKSKL